jgi:hypothetical protein
VADHLAEGHAQRERDEQLEEQLDLVGEAVGVLEGMGGVGVERTAAVVAEVLDRLL